MKNYVLIVDLGIGNLQSVANAIKYFGYDVHISSSIDDFSNAKAIVLPGVGAFNIAMEKLKELNLYDKLKQEVLIEKKPLLGICLGMQVLFESSTENGFHEGLGFIEGKVIEIDKEIDISVPHVGWNNLEIAHGESLFKGLPQATDVYFDHSYHVVCDMKFVSSTCEYETVEISASVQKENIFGVQFHPEKSQMLGLQIIENFLKYMELQC